MKTTNTMTTPNQTGESIQTENIENTTQPRMASSMFGLAVVRKSYDPDWNYYACVYPSASGKPTRWFKSQEVAQRVADKFNQA